jgi:hypothetical protein
MGSSARVVLCHTVLAVRLPCRAEAALTQHAAWHGIAPNNRNRIADIGEPHHTSLEIAPSLPWRMIGACRSPVRPADTRAP